MRIEEVDKEVLLEDYEFLKAAFIGLANCFGLIDRNKEPSANYNAATSHKAAKKVVYSVLNKFSTLKNLKVFFGDNEEYCLTAKYDHRGLMVRGGKELSLSSKEAALLFSILITEELSINKDEAFNAVMGGNTSPGRLVYMRAVYLSLVRKTKHLFEYLDNPDSYEINL